ncbi:MAG: hypothetical protein OIN86_18100 [Candidatus Methanoperedens sp.]|nr:hypothetical protein [Candidatus Methanoperedens sp.]CAG0959129.1 hypothetical protein METP1_00617 [Methanosarcinales archaeon]
MGLLGNAWASGAAKATLQNVIKKFGPNSDEAKAAYDECVKIDKKFAEENCKPILEKALEKERIAELPEEQRDAAKAEGQIKDIEREMDKGKLIFNTKDNIEDLCNKNMFSLMDVQMQEAGSAWSKLGSILSMDSGTQLMAAMLKANSDENKIMIRQNEIIIRLLKQIHRQNLLISRNSSQAEADHEDAI